MKVGSCVLVGLELTSTEFSFTEENVKIKAGLIQLNCKRSTELSLVRLLTAIMRI